MIFSKSMHVCMYMAMKMVFNSIKGFSALSSAFTYHGQPDREIRDEIAKLDEVLAYPFQEKLFEREYHTLALIPPLLSLSTIELMKEINSLNLSCYTKRALLVVIQKYFNTFLEFDKAFKVFLHILRHDLSAVSLFHASSVRNYVGAKFLADAVVKKVRSKRELRLNALLIIVLSKHGSFFRFMNYLSRKRVLIHGAGPHRESVFNENEFFINVSLNGSFNGPREEGVITYVRGDFGRNLSSKVLREVVHGSDFVCFKSLEDIDMSALAVCQRRQALRSNSVFSVGHLNGVPDVLIDLLGHGASKVGITGTDFNLSKSHMKGYRPENMDKVDFTKIFGFHPAYIQFLVVRHCFNNGLVLPDTLLREILMSYSLSKFIKDARKTHEPK